MIICFLSPTSCPVQNVCLEHLIAPKYGKIDGQVRDDPHAHGSWDFLRNLCIGQRVLVAPPTNHTDLTRSHPAFGKLPVCFTRVRLVSRDNEDVGLICVTHGWVKIRAPRTRDSYVNSLISGEASAKKQNLGIWRPNGLVRPLPVDYSAQTLLDIGEFDAVVESVINGTTFALFLVPRHEHIVFQVSGCRSPSARRDQIERCGQEAREFTIKAFLHRSTRVRLCSTNDGGLFLGSIIDRSDRCIRALITEGLARFNPNTADLAPSAVEYERCECEARAQRRGIWVDEPPFATAVHGFQGEVRRIVGTAALVVDVRGEHRLVQFACVRVPPFIAGGGAEPFSFEARERLRKLLVGQTVDVVVDGATHDRFFGTVLLGGNCVNELLLREGFAKVVDPICGRAPQRIEAFRKAQAHAVALQVGVHGRAEPPALIVRDYSLNFAKSVAAKHLAEFRGARMRGVVEHVLGGNRFALLVPDRRVMLRCGVNGLRPLSPSDCLGQEAMAFCERRYLNREIEFCVQDVDRSGGYIANMALVGAHARVDIAAVLLGEGLAEIHDGTAAALPNYQQLIDVRDRAVRNRNGKWADPSRFQAALEVGRFYPVRLIRASTAIDLIVQFLSETMHEIDEIIRSATPRIARSLTKNELVCVVHHGARYRGRIEIPDDVDRIRVRLIDFDTVIEAAIGDMYELSKRLENVPPQAISVRLAFLTIVRDHADERSWLWQRYRDYALYVHPISVDDAPIVLIYDRPDVNAETLNYVILEQADVGFGDVDFDVADEYEPIVESLRELAAERNLKDDFDHD